MTYDYTCEECEYTFEESGVRMDDRETPRKCPSCEGKAIYNPISSIRGARTAVHQDLVSFMEGRFGQSPSWQGPQSTTNRFNNSAKRSGPGAQRVIPGAPGTRKAEV
jgi:putative FmdB family regulatory protein